MGSKLSLPVVSLTRAKIVIVTGGNAGIGYETSKTIAMMGATVIVACRSEDKALEAIEKMNAEFQEEKAKGREGMTTEDKLALEFMKLDLSSMKSTVDFIEAFKASGRKLHCMICNAGICHTKKEHTADGYELMFQTNYLGHFLMAAHFLPIMKDSGEDCRMVFVSSAGHSSGKWDMERIQAKDDGKFDRLVYYCNSKLYQVMQMYSMVRRLQGSNVTVTSLHPGVVNTGLMSNYGSSALGTAVRAGNKLNMTRATLQGAATSINCAVSPKLAGVTGVYFADTKPKTSSPLSRNEEHQEELWNYTVKCLENYITEDILNGLEGKN